MSVIKMFGYEAAQQTEYQTKKWATKEEMQALSSGDEQRDVILAQGATVAFYEDDKRVQQCFCLWRHRQRQNGEFYFAQPAQSP